MFELTVDPEVDDHYLLKVPVFETTYFVNSHELSNLKFLIETTLQDEEVPHESNPC